MRSVFHGAVLIGFSLVAKHYGAEDTSIIIGFLIAVLVRIEYMDVKRS